MIWRIRPQTHQTILRPQGLDALGDIAIIDVAAIDVHEVLEGRWFVPGSFVGRAQFVVEGHARLTIDAGNLQSLFIPADSGLGYALFEETLGEPGIGLHDLRKGASTIYGLTGLLQFSDGLIQQPHFAEGDAEIVVSLRIVVGCATPGFEVL